MKIQFITALILLASTVFSADTTPTGQTIKPTAGIPVPPGVVCPMTVCPTVSLSKRDLACPVICPNNCSIVDDICCPGQQKAVCNTNSTASAVPSGSSAVSSVPAASAAPTGAAPTTANASSSATAASSAGTQSSANSQYAAVLSTCVLGVLLTLGLNQF